MVEVEVLHTIEQWETEDPAEEALIYIILQEGQVPRVKVTMGVMLRLASLGLLVVEVVLDN
jgi:hypothetical protein|tara:strand:- start:272 stop:454 length:183 start_codon:yes stop_codon:yes gene_type:complete